MKPHQYRCPVCLKTRYWVDRAEIIEHCKQMDGRDASIEAVIDALILIRDFEKKSRLAQINEKLEDLELHQRVLLAEHAYLKGQLNFDQPVEVAHPVTYPQSSFTLTSEEITEIQNNYKIRAIKLLRERVGLSLRDAKAVVDSATHPDWVGYCSPHNY